MECIIKQELFELSIFGERPAFSKPLLLGAPNIGDRAKFFSYMNETFDKQWLTNNGTLVQAFERRLASFLGVRHCLAVCNGTVALQIAARALQLSGEVILPSFTFVATAHALKWLGLQPVFCDIDPRSHCIDPAEVERLITPRTTGILGVHLWGRTCDVVALEQLARKHGLKLLYDASHAFGHSIDGHMVGSFGDAEVFSFHATKLLNTFEGGAIAINDDGLMNAIKSIRNFGFGDSDFAHELGTNGKMSEVSAAMGLVNLDSLDTFIARNAENYEAYVENLRDIPGIRMVEFSSEEKCAFQYVPLEVGPEFGISRDQLWDVLKSENIFAKRYFYPSCHRVPAYAPKSNGKDTVPHLPRTEQLELSVLALPTGIRVSAQAIRAIAAIIRLAHAGAYAIQQCRLSPLVVEPLYQYLYA